MESNIEDIWFFNFINSLFIIDLFMIASFVYYSLYSNYFLFHNFFLRKTVKCSSEILTKIILYKHISM